MQKCNNGGTIQEHCISSKFNFTYRCLKAERKCKGCSDKETSCNKSCIWYGKAIEEIHDMALHLKV